MGGGVVGKATPLETSEGGTFTWEGRLKLRGDDMMKLKIHLVQRFLRRCGAWCAFSCLHS